MVFIASLPFSQGLDPHKLIILAAACEMITVEQNTIMVRQEDQVDSIFFIESGQVLVSR
jgi:CRP-like cAMP-binding protein